jgi:predicted PurR-regulated permease PerM
MAPDGSAEDEAPVRTVQLDTQTVVVALLGLTALSAFFATARAAPHSVTIIVVAMFFGMALDPIIVAWQRVTHWSRGPAATTILLLAAVIAGAFFALAGPELANQSAQIETDLPRTVDSLADLPLIGGTLADHDVPEKIKDALGSIPERMAGNSSDLSDALERVTFGASAVLMGLVLLSGVALEGPMLVRLARGTIPLANRELADEIGRVVYNVVARYFAGNLLLATLHALWVTGMGLLAGVPLSPVLGVWVAITSLIPQIGGLLGFVLVFIVSLSQGLGVTLFMSATFFLYMTLNNNVLLPLVVGRVVDVSAPITMLAAIGGFSVAGVVGSLLAVPTIGAVKAVTSYVRHRGEPGYEPPGSTPMHLDVRGRLHRLRARHAT